MGFGDGSGIIWTICKRSTPHSRQITTPTTSTTHHSTFTGLMLFLTPNQQCQSTEGIFNLLMLLLLLHLFSGLFSRNWTELSKVLHPNRHKIGHFGDVLPSQSLGSVQKKTTVNKTKLENTKQKWSKLMKKNKKNENITIKIKSNTTKSNMHA